jgi:hypothetical protein
MDASRKLLGVGLGIAVSAFVVATTDAEAGGARRRHRFKTSPAPERGKTPALDANGASDGSAQSPVAGAAVEGGFRQDVVCGGALLEMSPDLALALNSYSGLALVDTSDPAAPRVLATVATEGTAMRMLLGDGDVAVVSDVYGPDGSETVVASIAVGEDSLTPVGAVRTPGSLRDAARTDDDIVLVVGANYYGPMPMFVAGGGDMSSPAGGFGADGSFNAKNAASNDPTGAVLPYPWYGGGAGHVVRVRIDDTGAPSILGTAEIDGDVLAGALTGTEAVLAVQASWYDQYYVALGAAGGDATGLFPDGSPGGWSYPQISLVRYADDANGAPTSTGALVLVDATGVLALDRDGSTLRALAYGDTGNVVATYDLSGGAPTPLDSLVIGEWPAVWAFSGDAFVYGTTQWNYYEPWSSTDPVFDPDGVKETFEDAAGAVPGRSDLVVGPTSAVKTVALGDPSDLVAGSPIDVGSGWLSSMLAVDGGVVCARNTYDGDAGTTDVLRVDVSNPAVPQLTGSVSISGYANLGPVLGDVLLVSGGTLGVDGSFVPSTRLVGLGDGGLALGGSYSVGAWTAAAARDGDLLGLASYDRLTLVDISDQSNPQVAGEVRFVVNVAGFAALGENAGVVLATEYVGGSIELRTVALPAAEALSPLSTLEIGTGDAQMFAAPPFVYVVSTNWSSGRASLTVVDASDPTDLVKRGTLDLASYPGQVFLKDGALLLLRRAESRFVEFTTKAGKKAKKAAPDAFGRAPKSWLRNGFAAVLDVVDLADPDAPRPARRKFLAWDHSGAAVLSGDSLFVPTYLDMTRGDGEQTFAYIVAEIDVTNPLRPRGGAPVDVPGQLVAAAGAPHQVLTVGYDYDFETGASTSTLNLVDLSLPWTTRVLASVPFSGYPEAVTVGGGRAYAVVETWGGLYAPAETGADWAPPTPSAQLLAFDVSDLSKTSSADRKGGAYAGQIAGGCLFLRTWGWNGAIDVYSLEDPAAPEFVATENVVGNVGDIVVVGGRAYAPGGLYGVQSFDLSK